MIGAPIGGNTLVSDTRASLARYDPAQRKIVPMALAEQAAVAASYPKGTLAVGVQQSLNDAATQASNDDPNSQQAVQEGNLQIEHPSAFAALRGRGGFPRPRRGRGR